MILDSQPVSRNTRPVSERPCAIELCGKDMLRHVSAIFYTLHKLLKKCNDFLKTYNINPLGTLQRPYLMKLAPLYSHV